jgi:hypothetical protein
MPIKSVTTSLVAKVERNKSNETLTGKINRDEQDEQDERLWF